MARLSSSYSLGAFIPTRWLDGSSGPEPLSGSKTSSKFFLVCQIEYGWSFFINMSGAIDVRGVECTQYTRTCDSVLHLTLVSSALYDASSLVPPVAVKDCLHCILSPAI